MVSALLYCSTMFVLLVGGGGGRADFFFLHLHNVYKRIIRCNDPEHLTNGFSMGREAYG